MKKNLFLMLLIAFSAWAGACHSDKDQKKEDPNKAPMFRPLHHSKDSANA
jgi:hypothetical protein